MNNETKILGVTPVQHKATEENGTLYIIANKNSAFYGLSFYFEDNKTDEQHYIASFVLNHAEVKAITEGLVTTMRDLAYIFTTQNSYLDIMKLSGADTKESTSYNTLYHAELINKAVFELDVHEFQWEDGDLRNEYINNNNMCGIRLAIVDALKNANEVKNTGNAIVNYSFPKEANIKIRNYYCPF